MTLSQNGCLSRKKKVDATLEISPAQARPRGFHRFVSSEDNQS
jgi:hypothetical protein